jgi:hypothetical protein
MEQQQLLVPIEQQQMLLLDRTPTIRIALYNRNTCCRSIKHQRLLLLYGTASNHVAL